MRDIVTPARGCARSKHERFARPRSAEKWAFLLRLAWRTAYHGRGLYSVNLSVGTPARHVMLQLGEWSTS